jgi:post-segregation antitoxin (ccd killing protein)
MNKIRRSKVTNSGRRDTSAETVSALTTVLAPPGGDLSEQDRHWQRGNRAAIDCYNEWIAEHGLPLEEFRWF